MEQLICSFREAIWLYIRSSNLKIWGFIYVDPQAKLSRFFIHLSHTLCFGKHNIKVAMYNENFGLIEALKEQ